ncbi:MAG TPA: thiamine pyrophosphate-dependent enzyme, partial [Kofleriaceae bacterium]
MTVDVLELASSLAYLDQLNDSFLDQPNDVDSSWHGLLNDPHGAPHEDGDDSPGDEETPGTDGNTSARGYNGTNGATNGANGTKIAVSRTASVTTAPLKANPTVWPLVNAYRSRGHFNANLDPLGLLETASMPELDLAMWGFTERDMTRTFEPTGVYGLEKATLQELIAYLQRVYSGSVGLEFMHIQSPSRRSWLAERMEKQLGSVPAKEVRVRMLQQLINAETFERFCHTKYPGTKRFSLEGAESLIPGLDLILSHGARLGAIEAVLGMAHRGRLTTIETILRHSAREMFGRFEDIEPEKSMGGGDVKYHLGFSTDRIDANGTQMHVSLAFNPSHLEAVDPVVAGRVRAKQTRHGDVEHRRVMGVMVHGDAAFAGQGLVAETLQLSSLPGYRTGGTVHLIVNNQVGFTASPAEQRSTPYCTDI